MTISIRQIAKGAGLAASTVSRIFSGVSSPSYAAMLRLYYYAFSLPEQDAAALLAKLKEVTQFIMFGFALEESKGNTDQRKDKP